MDFFKYKAEEEVQYDTHLKEIKLFWENVVWKKYYKKMKKVDHMHYSENSHEYNMGILLEIIFPEWKGIKKDGEIDKTKKENIKFPEISEEEYKTLEKILSNHPIQHLNTQKYIRENITIDRNNYYTYILKSSPGCPSGFLKSSKEKVIAFDNMRKVYRYYLVRVDLSNLPPIMYQNKKSTKNPNWWLPQHDLMIFDMFNCKYELNTDENINCYYYDEITPCKHSLLEMMIKFKQEHKCNKIIKGYMTHTIGHMQRCVRKDADMSDVSKLNGSEKLIFSKMDGEYKLKKKDTPMYALYRFRALLYPYGRYVLMNEIKNILDYGVKQEHIYRIYTDSITIKKTSKSEKFVEELLQKNNIWNGYKVENKPFKNGGGRFLKDADNGEFQEISEEKFKKLQEKK